MNLQPAKQKKKQENNKFHDFHLKLRNVAGFYLKTKMFAYLFDKSYYFPELQFNFFKINRLMSAEEKKTSRKQNWKTIDLARPARQSDSDGCYECVWVLVNI